MRFSQCIADDLFRSAACTFLCLSRTVRKEDAIIILSIILCGVFVGAFLFLESRKKYAAAVIFKGLASSCFVITGLLLSPGTQTANLITAGLVTGCAADIVIELRKLFVGKAVMPFLAGCILFLAGHVMYLSAVFPMSSHRFICAVAAVILAPPLIAWIYKRIKVKAVLKTVGIVYVGTVMLLNCTAVSNLAEAPSAFTGTFTAGALLFLASDVLLMLNTFGEEYSHGIKNVHISLYYAGQILIALSLR